MTDSEFATKVRKNILKYNKLNKELSSTSYTLQLFNLLICTSYCKLHIIIVFSLLQFSLYTRGAVVWNFAYSKCHMMVVQVVYGAVIF